MQETLENLVTFVTLVFAFLIFHRNPNAMAEYTCDTPPEWQPTHEPMAAKLTSDSESFMDIILGTYMEEKISAEPNMEHHKWPGGVLKYILNFDPTKDQRSNFTAAITEFERKTCLRFQARKQDDPHNYVIITINNTISCGRSEVCMKNKPQIAEFTDKCFNKETIVHELGHALCLSHEHLRTDRDDFVSFASCDPAVINERDKPRSYKYTHKGIYDYASQMHYRCSCLGKGGISKDEHWNLCGDQIPGNRGLSIMDAEYLNELYECQGCHRHRWRLITSITEDDLPDMYSFGLVDTKGRSLYPCRALVSGEVSVGVYVRETKECNVTSRFRNESVAVKDKAEVLILPGGLSSCVAEGNVCYHYQLVNVLSERREDLVKNAVPAGNGWSLDKKKFGKSYVAYGSLTPAQFQIVRVPSNTTDMTLAFDQIGSAWDWGYGTKLEGVFATSNGSLVNAQTFKVLTCLERSSGDVEDTETEKKPAPVDEHEDDNDCESGCYKGPNGECECSPFDDY